MHQAGIVLPGRGDGLHWLACAECGREWAERDSGAFAKGSRMCATAPSNTRPQGANPLAAA